MITPERIAGSSEHSQQVAIFCWIGLNRKRLPDLDCVFAIPNGEQRSRMTGAKLKAAGVRAGIPDICAAVPRRGYGALYLELKTTSGTVGVLQKVWHERLQKAGNCVKVVRGWEEAVAALEWYLIGERYNILTDELK